jgi:hypothetical protein
VRERDESIGQATEGRPAGVAGLCVTKGAHGVAVPFAGAACKGYDAKGERGDAPFLAPLLDERAHHACVSSVVLGGAAYVRGAESMP